MRIPKLTETPYYFLKLLQNNIAPIKNLRFLQVSRIIDIYIKCDCIPNIATCLNPSWFYHKI